MRVLEIIEALAYARSNFPRDAIRAAIKEWEDISDVFLELLRDFVEDGDRSDETTGALFFIVHLMGQMNDQRAFPLLCQMCGDPDAPDLVLGDGVTESLAGILISTWNGEKDNLKLIVEAPYADEFVRLAALQAMGYLTAQKKIERDVMKDYIRHLMASLTIDGESPLWDCLAFLPAQLGETGMEWVVVSLQRQGLIDCQDSMKMLYQQYLALAQSTTSGLEAFHRGYVRPMENAETHLEKWFSFSTDSQKKAQDVSARRVEWQLNFDGVRNPYKGVGRNDACPCGSGKKFKKCCITPETP